MYFGTINYVKDLVETNQENKAMAFWMYAYNMEFNRVIYLPEYAKLWCVSEEICSMWIDEFTSAITDSVAIKRVHLQKHTKAL